MCASTIRLMGQMFDHMVKLIPRTQPKNTESRSHESMMALIGTTDRLGKNAGGRGKLALAISSRGDAMRNNGEHLAKTPPFWAINVTPGQFSDSV